MGELARSVHKDKSTATFLIKKLEKEGYIQRQRSEAYTDATEAISRSLIDTCYAGFSEDEKQTLFSLLRRVEKNFAG